MHLPTNSPALTEILAVFAVSLIASIAAVWLTRLIALRLRFVDRKKANTRNSGGAAMGGGVAVIVVTLLIVATDHMESRIVISVMAACALGLLDDLIALKPWAKALGQIACASLYVPQFPGDFTSWAGACAFLVLVSNSWNLVDVMDGLLGSIGGVCLAGVTAILLLSASVPHELWRLSLAASGALCGFLLWNKHPAKVLLGDAGSIPLGLLYGIVVVESFLSSSAVGVIVLLPGLIPIFEVVFLIIKRTAKGIPFYRTTPDHFALRMHRNGKSISGIVGRAIIVSSALSIAGVIVVAASLNFILLGIVAGLILIFGLLAFRYFSRLSIDDPVH